MNPNPPFLSVQNVVKRYQQHTALSGVSFDIPQGSIFGLLGPNGAGKTTLIRIINQIIGPDEGQILLNGKPLTPADTRRIGYLPEERGLYKKMKIGEQALYLARLRGLSAADARKEVKYWFEKFEIQSWWNKKVEELSKGMQQKVQFVCTVLHKPELIILDEPFSGFDPINADLLKREILFLREQGATIIFSTHRMESVEELCERIALINQSKVVLEGNTREIKRQYSTNTFLLRYEGTLPALSAGFELLDSKQQVDGSQEARIQIGSGGANELLQEVIGSVRIHALEEQIPNFNEIFIRTVKAPMS
ncbi:MAG: ABC transporter ATP-binding protein [Sphingobacteriaceae bacterium]|nr:ABC transporter ATP-binding protein [Sphingobacteriaceae bacterium]